MEEPVVHHFEEERHGSSDKTPTKSSIQEEREEEEKQYNRGNNEQDYQSPEMLKIERKETTRRTNTQSFVVEAPNPLDHHETLSQTEIENL